MDNKILKSIYMVCRSKQENKETYIKKRYIVLPSTVQMAKNLNFNILNNTD
jgi:hypothetical protein